VGWFSVDVNTYDSVRSAGAGIAEYIGGFNNERLHSSLARSTPNEFCGVDFHARSRRHKLAVLVRPELPAASG
jgi:hypothetical protein